VTDCGAFDVLLGEGGDAGLDEEEAAGPRRAAFLAHLCACRPCLATFVAYSRAVEMARAAFDPRDEARAPLPERRVRAILAAVRAGEGDAGASTSSGVA
jgi:hypothetical protein